MREVISVKPNADSDSLVEVTSTFCVVCGSGEHQTIGQDILGEALWIVDPHHHL